MTNAAPVTIFVALLDEGTEVWRPVTATQVGPDQYRIESLNPDEEGERWAFQQGETVLCEPRTLSGGDALVAVTRVSGVRA